MRALPCAFYRSFHVASENSCGSTRRPKITALQLKPAHRCQLAFMKVDQLSDFPCDHFHGIVSSVQPASGGEQWADLDEFLKVRTVHDWDEPVTSQKCRQFLVRYALIGQALQERWCH